MSNQLYHCQNCATEWYFSRPAHYCMMCDSENIYSYPEPLFQPSQWVRYKPLDSVYPPENAQIAEIRLDGKGGWLYVLPKWLDPIVQLAEYPEDALEPYEYECRPRRL